MRPQLQARLARAVEELSPLPVLEGTAMEVRVLVEDPEASTDAVVAAIERDEAFAVNLLRFANSAAAARPVRARSVRQAVTLIGRRAIGQRALEAATYRFLERAPGAGGASRGQLHVHAVTVATIAAGIAERTGVDVDAVHLAGLLHDVGKLVLPVAFGAQELEQLASEGGAASLRAARERERLGVDHAYAGALVAEASGVPGELCEAIRLHHGDRGGQESPTREAACVQLANAIACILAGDPADDELIHAALSRLELPHGALDDLAQLSLPGAARRVEGSLSARVAELERLASVDDLTGVSNRRHWLGGVRSRLARGAAGGLLICDVDQFKTVNDRHGHRAGDLLLMEIAQVLARHGDTGRLGGDEFGVWVDGGAPEAQQAAAAIVADIRDQLPPGYGDATGVGISVGGALAPRDGTGVTALLEAADGALYAAKANGRGQAQLHGGLTANPAKRQHARASDPT
jgi:diguanylate cyclase (GGDEF)-like protein/putative nucleotidyltransferase with HDIG domain